MDDQGNVTPKRTIAGSATLISQPYGVAVSSLRDEVFVADDANDGILIFSRTANGDVAPIRAIGGKTTGFSRASDVGLIK